MAGTGHEVEDHYAGNRAGAAAPDLLAAIVAALGAAGKETADLKPEDLAAVDHLHSRGLEATVDQAEAAGIATGAEVLDVGCGIGGPARYLAGRFACRVTGLDLTEAYCRAAAGLTALCALSDRVRFCRGDARSLPFADASFDAAWTQYALMNVADKRAVYQEVHRVLRPGGRFAIGDVAQGPGGPPHFPVPWARRPEISFLIPPEDLRRLIEDSGFRILAWIDDSAATLAWRQRIAARRGKGRSPLGPGLVLGPDIGTRVENSLRSLAENRIADLRIIAQRRD